MSEISIKTGDNSAGNSACKAVLKICDMNNNCCQTTSNGFGLDDMSKQDRQTNQTDTYSRAAILNTCSKVCATDGGMRHSGAVTCYGDRFVCILLAPQRGRGALRQAFCVCRLCHSGS